MKIESFLILAEPHKLMYPYEESILSLAQFSNKVTIRYAASRDEKYRLFEKESFEKLCEIREDLKDQSEINIIEDHFWKKQEDKTYSELRSVLVNAINDSESDWFLKCDGDNVFQQNPEIRLLMEEKLKDFHCVYFPRINVQKRDSLSINWGNRDIYALNLRKIKSDGLFFEIGKTTNDWCRAVLGKEASTYVVQDPMIMPVNYDATFFTRSRIIDFWRKTVEVMARYNKKPDRLKDSTEEEVLAHMVAYKKRKIGMQCNIEHPVFIRDRVESLTNDHWGLDNLGLM